MKISKLNDNSNIALEGKPLVGYPDVRVSSLKELTDNITDLSRRIRENNERRQ